VIDYAPEMNFNAQRNAKYSKVYERRQARKLTKLEPNIFSYYFTKELPENVILQIFVKIKNNTAYGFVLVLVGLFKLVIFNYF
jgi:hypothetical protein